MVLSLCDISLFMALHCFAIVAKTKRQYISCFPRITFFDATTGSLILNLELITHADCGGLMVLYLWLSRANMFYHAAWNAPRT